MYPLKKDTAITIPIFAHDANGDAVTGLVDGDWTKRISKNGGAFGAMTVTITEMENGWYSLPVSASHSDTNGILTMTFTSASTKQVNLQFRVSTNGLDELATAVTLATHDGKLDTVDANVDSILVDTALMDKWLNNRIAFTGTSMILYDDDGTTPLIIWTLSEGALTVSGPYNRTPGA